MAIHVMDQNIFKGDYNASEIRKIFEEKFRNYQKNWKKLIKSIQ